MGGLNPVHVCVCVCVCVSCCTIIYALHSSFYYTVLVSSRHVFIHFYTHLASRCCCLSCIISLTVLETGLHSSYAHLKAHSVCNCEESE